MAGVELVVDVALGLAEGAGAGVVVWATASGDVNVAARRVMAAK
jgi:hypothetical protein